MHRLYGRRPEFGAWPYVWAERTGGSLVNDMKLASAPKRLADGAQPILMSVDVQDGREMAHLLEILGFVAESGDGRTPERWTSYAHHGYRVCITQSQNAESTTPISVPLRVKYASDVAAACWNHGYTVQVADMPDDSTLLTVVGPCGLRFILHEDDWGQTMNEVYSAPEMLRDAPHRSPFPRP